MFEVGFSEICMVGLVALLVIGPEKLPKIARLAGFWVGKAKNFVASVKAELNEELHMEEMRQLLNEQQNSMGSFQQLLEENSNATDSLNTSIQQIVEDSVIQVKKLHEPK